MSDETTASRSAIHQSLTRPLLLAGGSGAGAGDCQLDHGRRDFLRRRIALVHRDDQCIAGDGWALGARAGGKLRPATEPRLCAAHPISGLLSSSRRNLRAAGSCESVRS